MRGTHQGQQSARTAPTGRTHDCKRPLHHAPHDLLHGGGPGELTLLGRNGSKTRLGAEKTHNAAPPSARPVGFRRCRDFDAERSDRGLSDLASRGESVLQRGDLDL